MALAIEIPQQFPRGKFDFLYGQLQTEYENDPDRVSSEDLEKWVNNREDIEKAFQDLLADMCHRLKAILAEREKNAPKQITEDEQPLEASAPFFIHKNSISKEIELSLYASSSSTAAAPRPRTPISPYPQERFFSFTRTQRSISRSAPTSPTARRKKTHATSPPPSPPRPKIEVPSVQPETLGCHKLRVACLRSLSDFVEDPQLARHLECILFTELLIVDRDDYVECVYTILSFLTRDSELKGKFLSKNIEPRDLLFDLLPQEFSHSPTDTETESDVPPLEKDEPPHLESILDFLSEFEDTEKVDDILDDYEIIDKRSISCNSSPKSMKRSKSFFGRRKTNVKGESSSIQSSVPVFQRFRGFKRLFQNESPQSSTSSKSRESQASSSHGKKERLRKSGKKQLNDILPAEMADDLEEYLFNEFNTLDGSYTNFIQNFRAYSKLDPYLLQKMKSGDITPPSLLHMQFQPLIGHKFSRSFQKLRHQLRSDLSDLVPCDIACQIEFHILCRHLESETLYLESLKEYLTHLKIDDELRTNVVESKITPHQLVHMTFEIDVRPERGRNSSRIVL